MAAADGNLGDLPALTVEERRFIVQVLRTVQLNGNYAALRQALETIDSIIGKLGEELRASDSSGDSHLLP
jgi:hypothetical protein